MRTEVFNRSKYRDGSEPGDDVPLVVPGVIHGVFDGATDPRGTRLNGMAAGRFAALVVASEMQGLEAVVDVLTFLFLLSDVLTLSALMFLYRNGVLKKVGRDHLLISLGSKSSQRQRNTKQARY